MKFAFELAWPPPSVALESAKTHFFAVGKLGGSFQAGRITEEDAWRHLALFFLALMLILLFVHGFCLRRQPFSMAVQYEKTRRGAGTTVEHRKRQAGFVDRPVNHQAERAVVVVCQDQHYGLPEVRIIQAGLCDQKRTGKRHGDAT